MATSTHVDPVIATIREHTAGFGMHTDSPFPDVARPRADFPLRERPSTHQPLPAHTPQLRASAHENSRGSAHESMSGRERTGPRTSMPTVKTGSRVRFAPIDREDHTNMILQAAVQGAREARCRIGEAKADEIREYAAAVQQILDLTGSAREAELWVRSFAVEIAAHAHLSPVTASRRVWEAHEIRTHYPAALFALERGEIAIEHVRVILAGGLNLSDAEKSVYAEHATTAAKDLTPAQLRLEARRIAENIRPETLQERHDAAAQGRLVWVRDLEDGMAELGACLPAVIAYGVYDRLTRAAKQARVQAQTAANAAASSEANASETTANEASASSESTVQSSDTATVSVETPQASTPTIDQLRADMLAELLLTGSTAANAPGSPISGIVPRVTIIVPATGESAAELAGYGPISPELAREMSAVAPSWNRIAVDHQDQIVATDRYRPSKQLKRLLQARDGCCRAPGCRVALTRCDIDHTVEWVNGGRTEPGNLAYLCRAHHTLKHPDLDERYRWRVEQLTDGTMLWVSPSGGVYPTFPQRRTAPAASAPAASAPRASAPAGSAAARVSEPPVPAPSTSTSTSTSTPASSDEELVPF